MNGTILQLTGFAHIIWEKERITTHVGAERLILFEMVGGREVLAVCHLRGQIAAYSLFNPM